MFKSPPELYKCENEDKRSDNDAGSRSISINSKRCPPKPVIHLRNDNAAEDVKPAYRTCGTECQENKEEERGYGDGDCDGNGDETDLTNLTWLTELRCQNTLAWPSNAINQALNDDDKYMCIGIDKTHKNRKTLSTLHIIHANDTAGGGNIEDGDTNGLNQRFCANIAANDITYKNEKRQGSVTKRIHHVAESINVDPKSKPIQIKRPTPTERYEIFLDKVKRDLEEYEQFAESYQTDINEKPPFNYSHIIGMAMLENGRVTLQQICSWIESKFAFFRVRKKWNNSIRHNLSLHHCFRKINRNKYEKGKGGYWELGLDQKKCDRKRIRNRKSGKTKVKSSLEMKSPTVSPRTEHTSSAIPSADVESSNHASISQVIPSIPIGRQEDQQQTQQTYVTHISSNAPQHDNAILDSVHEKPTCHKTSNIPISITRSVSHLQPQQYQFGTIIISTLSPDGANSAIPTSFDCLINEPFGDVIQRDEDETSQNIYAINGEDFEQSCGNVIISSILTESETDNISIAPSSASPHDEHHRKQNVVVEQLQPHNPCYMVSSPALPSIIAPSSSAATWTPASTSNCDYTNIISDNFRPYIDGIEEAFQYLRSMDNNREDILDNLLDISVSDY